MAKEVTTSTWCDVCLDRDDVRREAGTTPPMDLQGTRAKARTLDLCPDHYAELVAPLWQALQAYGATVQPPANGRPPKAIPAAAAPTPRKAHLPAGGMHGNRSRQERRKILGPFTCEVPGCRDRPRATDSPNLDAFSQHLRARHNLTLVTYRQQYGEPGPGAAA